MYYNFELAVFITWFFKVLVYVLCSVSAILRFLRALAKICIWVAHKTFSASNSHKEFVKLAKTNPWNLNGLLVED